MLTELNNSIKAKLYDFTYAPFMSSMVISWIILNHKYLLIYFSDADLEKKLTKLTEHDFSSSLFGFIDLPFAMNIWFPIVFGLFYVFIYPYASEIFYKYTLEKLKGLKKIRQGIHDKTPILQEEANLLYLELENLIKQRDEAIAKVATMESKYKPVDVKKVIELEKIENLLSDSKDNKTEEDDKTKILRFFYESNYSKNTESDLLNNIVSKTKLARPKVNKIYKDLLNENILKVAGGFVFITESGNDKLLKMFDK